MKSFALLVVGFFVAVTNCLADKVLILGPTIYNGNNSLEAQAAARLGYGVDIVDANTWSLMTASGPAGFNTYRAIIFGDPGCGDGSEVSAAVANASVWGPVINGNLIIIGTDPIIHPPGGSVMITNAINYAAAQSGKTGLYCCLSCYYVGTTSPTAVALLGGLGYGANAFQVIGINGGCYNYAHIVATSPTMNGLSDAVLSDWSCSVHEGFTSWPNALVPVAIALNSGNSYTAPDLTAGTPYILANGDDVDIVTNGIFLTPLTASDPTNDQHTVSATVVEGGALAVGATVTFTIISGPNAPLSGTAVTGADGVATFTYTGTGGVGTDLIQATAVDSRTYPIITPPSESVTAMKTWYDPCGSSPLSATIDFPSTPCNSNVVGVIFNEYALPATALNISNYTLDNGLTVTNVILLSQNEVLLQASQDFQSSVTYTLTISNIADYCGRMITPNPTVLIFGCGVNCDSVICPTNIVAQCLGTNGTPVYFTVPSYPGCTNSFIVALPESGSLFPIGTTTVTAYNFSDGGTNFCTFTVTVTNLLPPAISCPSNIVIYASCSNVAVPFTVTASDNCCSEVSVVSTPPSGSLFPIGITTVNSLATDCDGLTNSCSFTVQVIHVNDPDPPAITFFPTNIVVCTTNPSTCGPMPDVTNQIQATDGGATLFISQSIPPGTVLCTNTNVTFTISNLCGGVTNCTAKVLVGPCCCNPLAALPWDSKLTNIAVWEGTNGNVYNFSMSTISPQLLAIPGGPTPTNFDFYDPNGNQYYDVYLSTDDGTPNVDGCCITIACYMADTASNYSTGNNIDAVELDFADGSSIGATSVGNVQLGQGLTDPTLYYNSGLAVNAVGLHDGNVSYLGYGASKLTLCYSTACSPTVSVVNINGTNYPYTTAQMHVIWTDPFMRNWNVVTATNLYLNPSYYVTNLIPASNIYPWIPVTGATNSPYIVTNFPAPNQFYKLQYIGPIITNGH
jgi:hypothetical protein